MTRVAALVLLFLAAAAPRGAGAAPPALVLPIAAPDLAARPRLALDRSGVALVAGGALAAWMASSAVDDQLHLTACRWCEPGRFDVRARDALRWRDGAAAAKASDILRLAVPLGSGAAVAWLAAREGGREELVEDVAAIAAAIAVTVPLTATVKHGSGRLRPGAWASGEVGGEGDLHSFFSGHTSWVFAAAASATQVARLRGRPGWRWLAAAAFAAAAGTAYLRVAADQHWATDVLAGAAAGTTVGFAVPALMLQRPGGGRARAFALAPAPGGLALVF